MQLPGNIDIQHPEKYVLTIRVTAEKLIICLYEPTINTIVYYDEIPVLTEDKNPGGIHFIYDSDFLTSPYKKTNVIYVSDDYELTPQYLIQKDKKETLYNFTHRSPAKQILYCEETIQEIITIFNVEEELYKFFSRNLFNVEFMHHANIMMQYIEKYNKTTEVQSKMYLNFHEKFVDIFCYDNTSRLQHAITYKDKNKLNTMYHILNIWDKSGLDQQNDYLYILGEYPDTDIFITSTLKDYIKHIDIIKTPQDIIFFNKNLSDISLPHDLLILLNK